MNENEVQPDSGNQEAESNTVAQKLGLMDERDLSHLLKSSFLDEGEAAPATQEQEESEAVDSSSGDDQQADDDSEHHDNSTLTRGVQKRINKLVAAKKAAQAELETHKARLNQLHSELQSVKSAIPVKHQDQTDFAESINTFQEIKSEYEKSVEVLLWCEDNLDGGVITLPDGTEHELSDKDVRAMKRTAIKRKEIELPTRLGYLQQQAQSDTQVIADFPWWGKQETEEFQVAQQIIRDFPELKKRRADWKHLAGLMVLGAKSYAESKARGKTQPQQIRRAPAQPNSGKAPPARASNDDQSNAKRQFAKGGGNRDGLTDLVKAMNFV